MSNTVTADRLGDIVLIVEEQEEEEGDDLDRACADPQEYETTSMKDFVFQTRGQSEEEPLRLEAISHLHKPSSSNDNDSTDDHTDETCEASSPTSSQHGGESHRLETGDATPFVDMVVTTAQPQREMPSSSSPPWMHDLMWLVICFVGIMASFVAYGILLEYATTGDRRLHERTCGQKNTRVYCFFFWLTSRSPLLDFDSLVSICSFRVGNRHGLDGKDCQEGNNYRYSRKSIPFARPHESRKYLLCYSILTVCASVVALDYFLSPPCANVLEIILIAT